ELIAPAAFAPRFAVTRRSAGSAARRAVAVAALAVVPAAQPLAEVADALAEPLTELRQPGGAEDQQHDGEDDQQLRDAKASEHDDLRGGTLRSGRSEGARLWESGAARSEGSARG